MKNSVYSGFERYDPVAEDISAHIKPGKSYTAKFSGDGLTSADRLFFTGETDIFYMWKSESDYQMLYRRIDDSLNSAVAERDRYALDLSTDAYLSYPKIAYKKLVAPFSMSYLPLASYNDSWSFGISVKAQELSVRGYLRMLVEVRYLRDGVDPNSIAEDADLSFSIDFPEGSYPLTDLSKNISFDSSRVASVSFFIEGENYSGEVYAECPYFKNHQGRNILPPFIPHTLDRAHFNWVGQNLSRVEWPSLRIELNGEVIHDGEIFERCHRRSEAEIPIPRGLIRDGENELTFTCTSDFHDAPGYVLCELGFITPTNSRIVSVPSVVTAGEPFSVFVTGGVGDEVDFSSDDVRSVSSLTLSHDGINALRFVCDKVTGGVKLTLFGEACEISRSVERGSDGVITGSGDMIYIDANSRDFENYLKWYLSSEVGDLLTIRPTYRWCGTRVLDAELWKNTAELLSEGGISYSHMIDGRDLPGCDVNPSEETLMGEGFLGRQTHEYDGQYVYWGFRNISADPITEGFHDLFIRMMKRSPETVNSRYGAADNLIFSGGVRSVFRRFDIPRDMKLAAEEFVSSLKRSRYGMKRHTGPATLFKYFYKAGYDFCGAELMYSPTELTSSALRGASRKCGGKVGSHLALQWSTSPHGTEERYRRFFLALYICYIQGIHEINTEEGLWHLEEYYAAHHRFSEACTRHAEIQRDFNKYIKSHTRRGSFYTPIAFLSGRYDGFRCFDRAGDVWGVVGMKPSEPEAAWDVLTYFYPRSVLDAIYRHDTPCEPMGYYTGTPRGNVDIIPIEDGGFSSYRLLVAPGYNAASFEDIDALTEYARCGGSLIIGWPQLSTVTERECVVGYDHEYLEFLNMPKAPEFKRELFRGKPITVCKDIPEGEVLIRCDGGAPIVISYAVGEGKVYFVNAMEYAGCASVAKVYRELLDIASAECLKSEKIYAEGDTDVQFAVYDIGNGCREVYFIATDWYNKTGGGTGKIRLSEYSYDIPVPFGTLIKLTANEELAVYPENDECEVLSIEGDSVRLQGAGVSDFIILTHGEKKRITVDFGKGGVKTIKI